LSDANPTVGFVSTSRWGAIDKKKLVDYPNRCQSAKKLRSAEITGRVLTLAISAATTTS
jgi:hypothetical protein